MSTPVRGGMPGLLAVPKGGRRLIFASFMAGQVVMLDITNPKRFTQVSVVNFGKDTGPHSVHLRECLRDRTDLRLIEAQTVSTTIVLAADYSPQLLIVDEPESNVVTTLSQLFAIVIVDDVPHGAPESGTRVRLLARPFTAEGLLAEVGRLLKPYDNKA